jgi:hypothetical protein
VHSPGTPTGTAVPASRVNYWRAIIIGLALMPFNVYWVLVSELRWHVLLTIKPLFITPICYLFFVVGANMLVRRLNPRWALSVGELLVIYIMLVTSCTVATHDFVSNLMCSTPWPAWMATPENNWENVMFPHLPKSLFVWDKSLLEGYFQGNSTIYDWPTILMWLKPMAIWSIVIFSIAWIMLCLCVLLRKAWMDDTKLSFPIVRLPLALVQQESPTTMLRAPALWYGFGLAAFLSLTNGLAQWIPNMIHFQTSYVQVDLPNPPWSAAAPLFTTFFPYGVGLAFLVPLDVSFSCWFFFVLSKLQQVFGYQFGFGSIVDFPFIHEQMIGAWFAFGLFLLYSSRHHISKVVKSALGPKDGSDANEAISYRLAFWGLVAGSSVFFAFWWWAGMNPLLVLLTLFTFLLLSICITRIRAESGSPHTVGNLEPKNLFRLFGSEMMGPANLAAAAMSHWYWRMNRSHMMPNQFEAMKMAQETGVSYKSLVKPVLISIVVAAVLGMWACLHLFYTKGAMAKCLGYQSYSGIEAYDWLNNAYTQGLEPQLERWWAVGFGGAMVVGLSWLRLKFTGFPFHPLGYCVGPGLMWYWMTFFVAWVLKLVILRYGGLKLYRKAVPFFIGMILGDYVFGGLWTAFSVITDLPIYQMFD